MNDTNKEGFSILLFAILLALMPSGREAILPLILGMVGLILAGWPRRA